MEDRIFSLEGIPKRDIQEAGFGWYLDQEYLDNEAIHLFPGELDLLKKIAIDAVDVFRSGVNHVIDHASWDYFDVPILLREMIIDSWNRQHMHLIGRFDIGGGINPNPPRLIEFNADTPTMLPESAYFQHFFKQIYFKEHWQDFNFLENDLIEAFTELKKQNPDKHPSIVVTSLGYEEDKLNAEVIRIAAEKAGFQADYADLEFLIFDDDGVFLEFQDGSDRKYDFMYKLVPWEFIVYEEPELLEILHYLQMNDFIYIMNPAYAILMQNKFMMSYIYEHFQRTYMLKTTIDKADLDGEKYVEKVAFGRLGENITIYNQDDSVLSSMKGDFGDSRKVYQEFTTLNQDDLKEYYQPGMYVVDKKPSAISFRRCEDMIVNDDSEYIPHFITKNI